MGAIHSTGSCHSLISVMTAIKGTITMTSNIIRARGNGVVRVSVMIAPTFTQPNKLAVLETIPCPTSPVTFVIGSSTAPIATIIIFNAETITKQRQKSTTWSSTEEPAQVRLEYVSKLRERSRHRHTQVLHSTSSQTKRCTPIQQGVTR